MDKNFFNIKSVISILVFLIFTLVFYVYVFELSYGMYERGFRRWSLIFELIVIPIFYLGSIYKLIVSIKKQNEINWKTVKLQLLSFVFLILLIVFCYILGMNWSSPQG
jgi:translation elongation factor EF-1alpha